MGRIMVISRKGAPKVDDTTDAPDTGSDNNENGGDRGAEAHTDSAAETVTCPECGCQFDPDAEQGDDTKAVAKKGDDSQPTGADLEIGAPTPDAQAPIGTDAVTKAIAAVLGRA